MFEHFRTVVARAHDNHAAQNRGETPPWPGVRAPTPDRVALPEEHPADHDTDPIWPWRQDS